MASIIEYPDHRMLILLNKETCHREYRKILVANLVLVISDRGDHLLVCLKNRWGSLEATKHILDEIFEEYELTCSQTVSVSQSDVVQLRLLASLT